MEISAAHAWSGTSAVNGKGDDVFVVDPPIAGLATFKVTHAGAANFVVTTYTADSAADVIDEIGKFSGEEQFADETRLVGVEADGAWSIAPS
jgi:hypothetical protein